MINFQILLEDKNRKIIFAGIILFTLISFSISFLLLSISSILLLIFFFVDTIKSIKSKWIRIKKNKIILLYTLLFLSQIIGLLYTENIEYGLKRINTMLPLIFVPAIIYSENIDFKYFTKIFKTFRVFLLLYFLGLIIYHVFFELRPLSHFSIYALNENLGISQFYIFFILLITILFSLDRIFLNKGTVINLIFFVIFSFFILLLSNKTSLILMTIAVIIKFIFIFKNNSLVSKVSFSFIIILLIGFISFNVPELEKKINVVLKSTDFDIEIIKTKNKVTVTKNTFEHRLLINYLSLKEVIENSWLGVGTGDYQDFLNEQYRKVEFKSGILKKLNNHNQFAAEILKTGLLGGVIFIILIFNLLNYGVYHYQNYMIVVILFSIACFLESYLDRQHGVMIFAFIIPVFYKYDQLKIEL